MRLSQSIFNKDPETWTDVDVMLINMALDSELPEDAKLTTKQRKALKSSTFCGPNRSFK